jgi:hypothetical protein
MLHASATNDSVRGTMEKQHLIDRLGGAKAVGDTLRGSGVEVKDVTVRSWTLAGRTIPAKYWVHVADIAKAKGVPLSFEALAQQVAA